MFFALISLWVSFETTNRGLVAVNMHIFPRNFSFILFSYKKLVDQAKYISLFIFTSFCVLESKQEIALSTMTFQVCICEIAG